MLDVILTVVLVIGVPAWMLWRSLARRGRPAAGTPPRYRLTIGLASALLSLLAVVWIGGGRSAGELGLAPPVSSPAEVGLGLAVLVLAGLAMGIAIQLKAGKPRPSAADLGVLPVTPSETASFLLMSFVVGAAWEVLYRGYLLWALTPHFGVPGAVVLAAAAYGLAHGYKNARQLAASLVAALAFTVGYVLTHSLWWLILIHIGMPVLAIASARRLQRATPSPVAT